MWIFPFPFLIHLHPFTFQLDKYWFTFYKRAKEKFQVPNDRVPFLYSSSRGSEFQWENFYFALIRKYPISDAEYLQVYWAIIQFTEWQKDIWWEKNIKKVFSSLLLLWLEGDGREQKMVNQSYSFGDLLRAKIRQEYAPFLSDYHVGILSVGCKQRINPQIE